MSEKINDIHFNSVRFGLAKNKFSSAKVNPVGSVKNEGNLVQQKISLVPFSSIQIIISSV